MPISCPLCGTQLPDKPLQSDQAWLSCPDCNVLFPRCGITPLPTQTQPEGSQIVLERTENSLLVSMPPTGSWAKQPQSVIWGVCLFLNLAWISAFIYFFFFFDPKQWLPSTPLKYWWLPLSIAVGLGLVYFVFIKTFGYLLTCWQQNRFCFQIDGFRETGAFLFLRATDKTKREEMIGIRAENDVVCLDRISTGLLIKTQSSDETCWLAYEIDHFYRTHPGNETVSPSFMDQIISGTVPTFPIICPTCKQRYDLAGETFRCGEPIGCRHCLKRIPLLVDLEEKRKSDDPIHGLKKFFANKTNCRITVQNKNSFVIRSKLLRGWWDISRNIVILIGCGMLFSALCILPFRALNEIGFFSFPFWKLHLITWWTLLLYVLCIPFWLGFLSLFWWMIRDTLTDLLTEWKITLTPQDVEYSFGACRKIVRRIPLVADLHTVPRNSYRLRQSLLEPRRWDNQIPATDQEFAIILRVGKSYFGEIPCRNTSEVETIAKLIENFLAKQPKRELSEEDHATLQPDPEIEARREKYA